MKAQTVLNKIQAHATKRQKLGYGKIKPAIPFQKTLNRFKAGKLEMSTIDFSGTSYGWYELTKTIKGKVVLNSYSYSSSTCKHIGKIRSVLSMLGVRYVEIKAPRGLQALDTALAHHLDSLGAAIVANKYARIKSTRSIKFHQKALANLALFGRKHSKKQIDYAVKVAEGDRSRKNQDLKQKRFEKMLTSYLENNVSFRDYQIVSKSMFGNPDAWTAREVAVHQVVEKNSMASDVENALYNFQRDGFSKIIFYVGA